MKEDEDGEGRRRYKNLWLHHTVDNKTKIIINSY